MKKVRTLSDLEQMIGKDSVERCFTEYFMTIIAQAKKYEDLQNHRAVMDEDEMWIFIESIGRTELYDEIEDLNNKNYTLVRRNGIPSSRYLKAIRVSLVAQGYDEQWVDTTFRDALEKQYVR
jgi:hypothetical protein